MNASVRAAGAFKNPHIKTELPGPKSRAMIEREQKRLAQVEAEAKEGEA